MKAKSYKLKYTPAEEQLIKELSTRIGWPAKIQSNRSIKQEGERMNENKYYLKVDNRIVAECIPLEYALIFIKSIFENYYNDHEIVISIAETKQNEVREVSE